MSLVLCDWAMPTVTKKPALSGLMCCREQGHDGRHYVHVSGRRSVWIYEVDERRRIVIFALHADTDGPLDREGACALIALREALRKKE